MSKRTVDSYYYKLMMAKPIANGSGVHLRPRQGAVKGNSVFDAMRALEELATGWGAEIRNVKLFEIDEHGEIVLQTSNKPWTPEKKDEKKPVIPRYEPFISWATKWSEPTFTTMKMEATK